MRLTSRLSALAALLVPLLGAVIPVPAQEQPVTSTAPNEVTPGTRFLVRLQDALHTKDSKAGDPFTVRTLEALASADGTVLPAGAEIRGHIDKIEEAHKSGRARMWLTFDDVQTPDGWIPLVAMVDDVPGVHSIRVDYNREGEIEATSDQRREALEATAAGALVGAAPGVAAHDKKDAAIGAAIGALTAYMVASNLGQEFTLEKNTKLELILERSLYFARN